MKNKIQFQRNRTAEIVLVSAALALGFYLMQSFKDGQIRQHKPIVRLSIESPGVPDPTAATEGTDTFDPNKSESKNSALANAPGQRNQALNSDKITERVTRLGEYDVQQTIIGDEIASFKILKNKEVLLEKSMQDGLDGKSNQMVIMAMGGDGFRFIDPASPDYKYSADGNLIPDSKIQPLARDMNGDGVPDLIVDFHTGMKCHNTMVISLDSSKPRIIYEGGLTRYNKNSAGFFDLVETSSTFNSKGKETFEETSFQWNGSKYQARGKSKKD